MDNTIEEKFNRMLEDEDWYSLGWFFWKAFLMLYPDGDERKVYERLWDSLTEHQKDLCEEV